MIDPDPKSDERSVWSSRFTPETDSIKQRIRNAPPVPRVRQTRTQAVLMALPFLMFGIGMGFHWYGEHQQQTGTVIVAEQVSLNGRYERITPSDQAHSTKSRLWVRVGDRSRAVRLKYEQRTQLQAVQAGDEVVIEAAPTVTGSSVLWLTQVTHNGSELLN